jgi:hypothetical protein
MKKLLIRSIENIYLISAFQEINYIIGIERWFPVTMLNFPWRLEYSTGSYVLLPISYGGLFEKAPSMSGLEI